MHILRPHTIQNKHIYSHVVPNLWRTTRDVATSGFVAIFLHGGVPWLVESTEITGVIEDFERAVCELTAILRKGPAREVVDGR